MPTWPREGVWALNISGRLDAEADLVIGVNRGGVAVYAGRPRTPIGWSRQATAREVDELLAFLDGRRAEAPALSDVSWRAAFARLLARVGA